MLVLTSIGCTFSNNKTVVVLIVLIALIILSVVAPLTSRLFLFGKAIFSLLFLKVNYDRSLTVRTSRWYVTRTIRTVAVTIELSTYIDSTTTKHWKAN